MESVQAMSFKDILKADCLNALMNGNEYAELITYNVGGVTAVPLNAIVIRKPNQPASEDNARANVNDFEIYISTDPIAGIPNIRRGKDTVIISQYEGSTTMITCLVVEIMPSDIGLWHLVVRQ